MDELLNRWLVDRRADVDRGELSPKAWVQYRDSGKRITAEIGHFLADEVSPDVIRDLYDRLARDATIDFAKRAIGHLRQAANHAADAGWCRPVRLGRTARLTTRPQPTMKWKLYRPAQVRHILRRLDRRICVARGRRDGRTLPSLIQLRAMVYLALNGGFNAAECAELVRGDIDLAGAIIRHRRGKTGAEHVVPLWPETIAALRDAMALRPGDDLVFRTREGQPWRMVKPVHDAGGKLVKIIATDNAHEHFRNLTRPMGLKLAGQSFGKLRHLHQTIADEAGDPHATFALAGHALPGAKSHYVKVDEARLRKVVEHIRNVLLVR
jgi:integrase